MARGHQRGPFLVPFEHRASLRGCFVCHWRRLHHSGWVSLCRPQTQSPPDFHASTAPHAGASHSFVHSSLRSSCSWSFWEIGQIAPCLKSLLVFSVLVSVLPSLSLPQYSLSVTAEGKHHITPQPVCTVYPSPQHTSMNCSCGASILCYTLEMGWQDDYSDQNCSGM